MSSASGGLRPPDPLRVSRLQPQHPCPQNLPTPLNYSRKTSYRLQETAGSFCLSQKLHSTVFESDLEDIPRHFRRSVPENNATEYAIPFRAVPWNNVNRICTC